MSKKTLENESGVPGAMMFPGVSALIETEGGGNTVMVCVTLAELSLPRAVKVRTCVPTSLVLGTHEKRPPVEMF
jgi:hypothetical protein